MPDKKWGFIKSRFLRLLVPLIIIGTFIINPLYVYIERLSSGETASGFFQWYPQFFDGMYGFGAILRLWGREHISGIWSSFLSTH